MTPETRKKLERVWGIRPGNLDTTQAAFLAGAEVGWKMAIEDVLNLFRSESEIPSLIDKISSLNIKREGK